MKIVLDTTILVRANEHSHGLARELLTNIVASEHRLLLSNEMLYELARVLRYPRLQAFYNMPENLVFDYITEIVTLNPIVTAPIRDVNDVVVMQTSVVTSKPASCGHSKTGQLRLIPGQDKLYPANQ